MRRAADEVDEARQHIKVNASAGTGPDFLVIGTQKGGTTDVFDRMLRRPEYALTESTTANGNVGDKELHFFDWSCLGPPQGRGIGGRQAYKLYAKPGSHVWCDSGAYVARLASSRAT